MATTAVQPQESEKKTKDRSPAYPFISLKAAVDRARQFHKEERRSAAPISVAVKHWGYKEKSSGGIQTIAALKYFGLLQDTGTGKNRKVALSEPGLKIVMDERTVSPERDLLLKKAALMPKMYARLWNEWGTAMPSEETVRHHLRVELKFIDSTVDSFIRGYKDTIAFAKLTQSDKVSSEDGNSGESEAQSESYAPKIGDYVQWESNGVLRMKEPAKLARMSSDGGFAFLEGSSTGVPVGELIKAEAPPAQQPQIVRSPALPTTTMQEDVYSLPEGRLVVQWPASLSPESIEEIKGYLKLLEVKIKRSVATVKSE